jgi:hypothetical protein
LTAAAEIARLVDILAARQNVMRPPEVAAKLSNAAKVKAAVGETSSQLHKPSLHRDVPTGLTSVSCLP